MRKIGFAEAVLQIVAEDGRYQAEAYQFVREGLDFTVKMFNKPSAGPARHVTGRELLEGIRSYALQEYGPMGLRVLNHWGLHTTEDVGEIVFNLVSKGVLGKTDEDRREDFANGYDFTEAFRAPFLPRSAGTSQPRPAAAPTRPGTPAPGVP